MDTPSLILTTGKASLAVIFKYFNTVDLLMNFFAKINVELGSELQERVRILEEAEFPDIGFLGSMSISKDGG